MPWCEQCGSAVSTDARFCASCGRRVATPGEPAATSTTTAADPSPAAATAATAAGDPSPESPDPSPESPGVVAPGPFPTLARLSLADQNVPAWVRGDWPAAAVAALLLLGTCLAGGLLYGAIAGLAGTGRAGGILSGALTGAYLPFAMFGVETAAVRFAGDATFGFTFKTLPLPLAGVVVLGVYVALRFAWPRISRQAPNVAVFVVKLALVVATVATVMAALLSIGDPRQRSLGDNVFAADVSVGSAALYPFILVIVIAVVILLARNVGLLGTRVRSPRDTDVGRALIVGAVAFFAVAGLLALVVLVADLAVADTARERFATAVGFFATGLNRGIAAAVFAMGGAVERFVGHTSLFDWGSYERPGVGTAPVPLFAWVGLAPAAVAYAALRCLDSERPSDEQGVARVAAAVASGFVVTSTVLVILTGQHRIAAGSPRAGFGLALLWALLGACGAGILWARGNGVRWHALDTADGPDDQWVRDKRRQATQIIDAAPDAEPSAKPSDPPPTLIDPDS